MLNQRQASIISSLISKKNMHVQDIADVLQVSARTIKREISILNAAYPNLIISSKKGYALSDAAVARQLLQQFHESEQIPSNYKDRRKIILKQLLLNNKISINDLCACLYISDLTLLNDLNTLRKELAEFSINLHIQKDIVTISGSQRGIHKILLDMINSELEDSFFSVENIQNFFPNIDIQKLNQTITDILNKHQLFLDDYALINYIIHIAMMLKMPAHPHSIKEHIPQDIVWMHPEFQTLLEDIYTCLQHTHPGTYQFQDLKNASLLMMTRLMKEQSPNVMQMSDHTQRLLVEIIDAVRRNYSIDLKNDSFLIPFSYHLANLLIRLKTRKEVSDIQFRQIKNHYPLLYSISVFISKIIEKDSDCPVSEDEIALIALHIGNTIEQMRIIQTKVACIVLAPNYYAIGQTIADKLKQYFKDSLYVRYVITSIDQLNEKNDIDLIITTHFSTQSISIPTIVISPFFSERDIKNCMEIIDQIKNEKRQNKLLDKINFFFSEDAFFVDENFNDKEETIDTMCAVLYEKGYVNASYRNKIYEREQIASSAYDMIAIPHPLENKAERSIIAVCIEKKGIHWDGQKVNIIFMLSLKEEDRELFIEIFDFITLFLQNKELYKELLHTQSFDEFKQLFLSSSRHFERTDI